MQPIQKLLAVEHFPIQSKKGEITPEEWLRMAVDLGLARFAMIRDCALHVINEVYALGRSGREIGMRVVRADLVERGETRVVDMLDECAKAGSELRDERNRLHHEGVQRGFGETDIFRLASMMEASSVEPKV